MSKHSGKSNQKPILTLSLFSGAGGLDLGGLPHRSGPTRMLGLTSVSSGAMPHFLYRAE